MNKRIANIVPEHPAYFLFNFVENGLEWLARQTRARLHRTLSLPAQLSLPLFIVANNTVLPGWELLNTARWCIALCIQ